jgi:hypothetical protein
VAEISDCSQDLVQIRSLSVLIEIFLLKQKKEFSGWTVTITELSQGSFRSKIVPSLTKSFKLRPRLSGDVKITARATKGASFHDNNPYSPQNQRKSPKLKLAGSLTVS